MKVDCDDAELVSVEFEPSAQALHGEQGIEAHTDPSEGEPAGDWSLQIPDAHARTDAVLVCVVTRPSAEALRGEQPIAHDVHVRTDAGLVGVETLPSAEALRGEQLADEPCPNLSVERRWRAPSAASGSSTEQRGEMRAVLVQKLHPIVTDEEVKLIFGFYGSIAAYSRFSSDAGLERAEACIIYTDAAGASAAACVLDGMYKFHPTLQAITVTPFDSDGA